MKQPVLDITGFFFPMCTQVKSEVRNTNAYPCTDAGKERRYNLYGRLRCFDSNVSNLYNNDVKYTKKNIKKSSEQFCL